MTEPYLLGILQIYTMKTSIPLVEIILLSASNCNYVSLWYLGYFLAKIGKPPGRKFWYRETPNIYLDLRHLVEYLELSIREKTIYLRIPINQSRNSFTSIPLSSCSMPLVGRILELVALFIELEQ